MKTLILSAIRRSLMFTAAAALLLAYPASANLVSNGGFETGDFTGWAHVGGDVDGDNPHSGNFAASLDFGALQQFVANFACQRRDFIERCSTAEDMASLGREAVLVCQRLSSPLTLSFAFCSYGVSEYRGAGTTRRNG